jgi:transcriptional regulator with XRE-family HTH domain
MNAGELLRRTRLDRGLNQDQLARRAATTRSHISRIERGTVSPSLKTLRRLVNAMGFDLRLEIERLPPGNASPSDLRADFRELTPEERVDQAMDLSEFLDQLRRWHALGSDEPT